MDFRPENSKSKPGAGSTPAQIDEYYMAMALAEARKAEAIGEVPIGAVLVLNAEPSADGNLVVMKPAEPKVIAATHNLRETKKNPVGHAELLALEWGSKSLDRWRLAGCTLYVTLEPCVMCAGAIILSRVDRVVYGATDPKAGAVESLYKILEDTRLNHRPQVTRGVLEAESSKLLKDFFAKKRS
jgi:tRNA(adenine34) deaminase